MNGVCENKPDLFPNTVSYNRFVELERKVAVPFIGRQEVCIGPCTGINFVDSTALRMCRNQRIHLHRVFRGGLPSADKILLRKRTLIETINDELNNMAQIEHSRHKPVSGFTVDLMAGLTAYSFFPKRPMIDLERVSPYENNLIQLEIF